MRTRLSYCRGAALRRLPDTWTLHLRCADTCLLAAAGTQLTYACRAAGSTRSEAAVVGTKLLGCGCAASRSRSRGLERRALRMILHGCTGRVCHAQVPSCSQPSQACARACGGPVAAPDTLDLGPSGGSLLRCSERHWLPREASASLHDAIQRLPAGAEEHSREDGCARKS